MADTSSILLKVHGRRGVMFSGAVSSLSSVNKTGLFDVLPHHSNFISLIQKKIVYRDAISKQIHEIPIDQAVMRATGNEVNIYLGLTRSN